MLGLSLAIVAPERLAGVIAVDGCLPAFTRPGLLQPVPSSLPVILVQTLAAATSSSSLQEATDGELRKLGIAVTTISDADIDRASHDLPQDIRAWFESQRPSTAGNVH